MSEEIERLKLTICHQLAAYRRDLKEYESMEPSEFLDKAKLRAQCHITAFQTVLIWIEGLGVGNIEAQTAA